MLRGCDHEHVVRFVGVVDGTTLLTELCAGGDLLRLLEGNAELGWPLRLRLAGDACRGLAYLHERGMMHRDVKAENVLLWQLKRFAMYNQYQFRPGYAMHFAKTLKFPVQQFVTTCEARGAPASRRRMAAS